MQITVQQGQDFLKIITMIIKVITGYEEVVAMLIFERSYDEFMIFSDDKFRAYICYHKTISTRLQKR